MADERLERAGLKTTAPRLKILKILDEPATCCLSAKSIYEQLLMSGDEISFATVYRVLAQLEAAGVVVGHNFAGDQKEFGLIERANSNHMVCEDTGDVVKFEDVQLENHLRRIAEQYGYEPVERSLSFRVRRKRD